MSRLSLCLVLGALLCWPLAPARANAEGGAARQPEWFAKPYGYVLVDQDVRAALTEFGHNLGLNLVFSDKVKGKARSSVRSHSAGEFLSRLCESNGLTWFYDGSTLYLNGDDEVATRLFPASPARLQALRDYLAELDVSGPRLASRTGPDGSELLVSGPPAYLALVQQHVDHSVPVAAPVREHAMRVFRGGTVSNE